MCQNIENDRLPPLVDDSNKYTTDRGTHHSPWITALDDNYYNPDVAVASKFISLTEIRFTNSNKQNVYNEKVTYYRQVHCNYIYELYLTEEEEKSFSEIKILATTVHRYLLPLRSSHTR